MKGAVGGGGGMKCAVSANPGVSMLAAACPTVGEGGGGGKDGEVGGGMGMDSFSADIGFSALTVGGGGVMDGAVGGDTALAAFLEPLADPYLAADPGKPGGGGGATGVSSGKTVPSGGPVVRDEWRDGSISPSFAFCIIAIFSFIRS